MADSEWEDLPIQLLEAIFSKVGSYVDFVHFGLVCELWRSTAARTFDKQKLETKLAPLLLFPTKLDGGGKWRLHDISGFCGSKLQLPENSAGVCCSSEGWVLTMNKNSAVTLCNPFVSEKYSVIHLPRLPTSVYDGTIHKFLTFTPTALEDPTDMTCVLVFRDRFDRNHILYIQPRKDIKWNISDLPEREFDDVVYYNKCFYAVTIHRDVFVALDFIRDGDISIRVLSKGKGKSITSEEAPGRVVFYGFLNGEQEDCFRYLVKSPDGELLQVEKIRSRVWYSRKWTFRFKVYKFCFETLSWTKIRSLGHSSLFLGDNGSIMVSVASRFSQCKPNHIYFTHAKGSSGFENDTTVFSEYNLETKSFTCSYYFITEVKGTRVIGTPVWVLPTIWF